MWNARDLVGGGAEIKGRLGTRGEHRGESRACGSNSGDGSLWARDVKGDTMLQLVAIAFFFAVLVALTVVLETTIRASWREIVDALAGREIRRPAPVSARPRQRAAA
jgi:hypothetical protein